MKHSCFYTKYDERNRRPDFLEFLRKLLVRAPVKHNSVLLWSTNLQIVKHGLPFFSGVLFNPSILVGRIPLDDFRSSLEAVLGSSPRSRSLRSSPAGSETSPSRDSPGPVPIRRPRSLHEAVSVPRSPVDSSGSVAFNRDAYAPSTTRNLIASAGPATTFAVRIDPVPAASPLRLYRS